VAALTAACVETGNYLGRGLEYVSVLRSMCARHLPEHRFVVISDRQHPFETLPAEPALAGWWGKLQLFKPGQFTGRVLYLDLDLTIRSSLARLVSLLDEGEFWALDDFAWPLSRAAALEAAEQAGRITHGAESIKPSLGGWGTCNSSVMLWTGDAGRDIWEQYSPEAAAGLHGDQNWITRVMGGRLNLIPAGWAGSYRFGPEGCPITVHHGDGKPHEVNDPNWY